MTPDPNVIYKRDYQTLRESLDRHPTANELLPLADAYKASYQEEINARKQEERASVRVRVLSDGDGEARASGRAANDQEARAAGVASEPLSGPDKPAEPERAESVPPSSRVNPGGSERATVVASAPCRRCGRTFERVARRGRPPVMCGECR